MPLIVLPKSCSWEVGTLSSSPIPRFGCLFSFFLLTRRCPSRCRLALPLALLRRLAPLPLSCLRLGCAGPSTSAARTFFGFSFFFE